MNAPLRPSDRQALEARLAARLIQGLTSGTEALPHDIRERLRVARVQAVERAATARRKAPQASTAPATSVVGVTWQGAALLGGPTPWWQRAVAVLPLLVLACGLVLIQQAAEREQVHAAAEVDTLLLADDLPPDAYVDPGFAEFLREPPP
jgi:hypothetical protein